MTQTNLKEVTGDFIEASGLLEYDPEKIKKIYTGHPRRLFKRIWQTLLPLGSFLLVIGIEKLLGILNDEKKAKKRSKEFADLLVRLGPAFIKAGQALSSRPDLVPRVVLEELAQLQDQLPGFNCELAMACIEEDLKKPLKEIFEKLDKNPISAASLGQVHKGILKSGKKVAVKVQRPGLREQITLDLYIVRNIAKWMKNNIGVIRSDLVGLIDELGTRVFEEMDYINEANNAERFKSLHKENKLIAVPTIYRKESSRRVLTMEWIDGVKLTKLDEVMRLGVDPNKMIEIGVKCSLKQLLEDGFFHADPHPGNILALKDGRLCYLDFGMMSEVKKESRTGLIQAVVHLVNRRFNKLSEDFVTLGFLDYKVDLRPIVPAFEQVFSKALEDGVNKMDFKKVTDDLSGIMYKFPFRVPPYYALIIRSLITLEGIALSVDPKFKILGAAYPYFANRLMEDPDPELRQSLKEMVFDEGKFNWKRMENLIKSASKKETVNVEILLDQFIEFLFSKKGLFLREDLTNSIIQKLDIIGMIAINKINKILPDSLKSKSLIYKLQGEGFSKKAIMEIEAIKGIKKTFKSIPDFKIKMLLIKIPKIIKEKTARVMGLNILKGLIEKSLVRVIKAAASEKIVK